MVSVQCKINLNQLQTFFESSMSTDLSMFTLPSGITFIERGWLSSNNILIKDHANAVLVDTGYWTHAEQTLALVQHHLNEQPLNTIINTHLHSDHCGGNALLQNSCKPIAVLVPSGHSEFVENWNPNILTYEPTGQYCPPFQNTGVLTDRSEFTINDRSWRCYSAPGHDPHSLIIFNEEDRILISADALWENGFGVVFPEIEGIKAFDDVEATLQLIEDLKPNLIFPGHGKMFVDVSAALKLARSRLKQFKSAPDKHGTYAAKVLVKFKLLELQKISKSEFDIWAENVSYLRILHKTYAPTHIYLKWIEELCMSLQKSSACTIDENFIYNTN
jgi:glyoxylase-like metal-dependent hydrolase (beta-lactamase superfamily II)